MGTIDVHTHIGFEGGLIASPQELIASMDQARIDKSLVLAAPMFGCPTERLLKEVSPYLDRLLPVASVSISKFSNIMDTHLTIKELTNHLENKRVHGLKFYTGYEHFYPYDADIKRYLDLMQSFNLPVIFHCGDTFAKAKRAKLKFAHPLHIDEVAVDFPKLNIIIAHLGFPWHRDAAEVVYKNPNVYTDCSGFVYGKFSEDSKQKFTKVLAEFAEIAGNLDKVLFGTDWPISDQASYLDVIADVTIKNSNRLAKSLFGIP